MEKVRYVTKYIGSLTKAMYVGLGFSIGCLIYVNAKTSFKDKPYLKNLDKKVVIVIGADDGFGSQIALELLHRGATVIFPCKSRENFLKVVTLIQDENTRANALYIQLDLTSFSSVIRFIEKVKEKFRKVHYLFNSAEYLNYYFKKTQDEIEEMLQANFFSPVVLVAYLVNCLKAEDGGRVINIINSEYKRLYTFNFKNLINEIPEKYKFEKEFLGTYQYGHSKACMLMFSSCLEEYYRRNSFNIKVININPGVTFSSYFNRNTSVATYFLYPFIWFFSRSDSDGVAEVMRIIDNDAEFNTANAANFQIRTNTENNEVNFIKDKDNIQGLLHFTKLMVKFYGQKQGLDIDMI